MTKSHSPCSFSSFINFIWTHKIKFPSKTLTQLKLVIDSFMRHLSSSFLHSSFPQFELGILAYHNPLYAPSWCLFLAMICNMCHRYTIRSEFFIFVIDSFIISCDRVHGISFQVAHNVFLISSSSKGVTLLS